MFADPITDWALSVVALLALIMMFTGISTIYRIKTYHLLSGFTAPHYTTEPLSVDEQEVHA